MRKEQLLNIYEDNGLYGAKDQNGQIVITAQYTEMYQSLIPQHYSLTLFISA